MAGPTMGYPCLCKLSWLSVRLETQLGISVCSSAAPSSNRVTCAHRGKQNEQGICTSAAARLLRLKLTVSAVSAQNQTIMPSDTLWLWSTLPKQLARQTKSDYTRQNSKLAELAEALCRVINHTANM